MPSASIHMSVCKTINKKYNRGNDFLIGNIAPDCWRHSIYHANKEKSHFMVNKKEDYNKFFEKYKDIINNDFVFGYLTHLITDFYWKTYVTPKYKIDDTKLVLKDGTTYVSTKEDIKEILHVNNQIATSKVAEKYDLKILSIMNNINCEIEEIDLSGLIKTIEHINKVNFIETYKESIIYNMEDIYEYIENCSEFILTIVDNLLKEK